MPLASQPWGFVVMVWLDQGWCKLTLSPSRRLLLLRRLLGRTVNVCGERRVCAVAYWSGYNTTHDVACNQVCPAPSGVWVFSPIRSQEASPSAPSRVPMRHLGKMLPVPWQKIIGLCKLLIKGMLCATNPLDSKCPPKPSQISQGHSAAWFAQMKKCLSLHHASKRRGCSWEISERK